jgi:hypothetical protein
VNDLVADGNVAYTVITGAAVSADPAYSGLDPSDVQCINIDNDIAQVYVKTRSQLQTSESGTGATYHMRLTIAPTAPVTCPIASNDTGEDTVSPASVTFTPTAYGFQTITAKGVPDGIKDGDQLVTIINGACTSADPAYNGFDPTDVSVVNRDIN